MPETFADTPLLTERFDRATALALDHHRRQLRKATRIPYVSHLLAVTAIVLELGGTEDEAIAALLHDAVEDGGGPAMQARIAEEFGEAVGRMVAQNSDSDQAVKAPWRERKEAYLAGMGAKDPGALLVSLADKLHNARAITADLATVGDEVWQRFTGGGQGTAWYYAALGEAFAAQLSRMSGTAEAGVAELQRLAAEFGRRTSDLPARERP